MTECYHDVELVLYTNGDNPEAIELMKQLQTQSKTARISVYTYIHVFAALLNDDTCVGY